MTELEATIVIIGAIGCIAAGLYLRFAPTYIRCRTRRYIRPPQQRLKK